MEKHGDLNGVGEEVQVVAGPHAGKHGIVKTAQPGKIVVRLRDGTEVPVDETCIAFQEK